MSSLASIRRGAEARSAPVCANRGWEPQKGSALNEPTPGEQRRFLKACLRFAWYQTGGNAIRKIVASQRVSGHSRKNDRIYGAPPARTDEVAHFSSEVNDHNKRLRGCAGPLSAAKSVGSWSTVTTRIAPAWYRTRLGVCESKEAEIAILHQQADAMFQADLLTAPGDDPDFNAAPFRARAIDAHAGRTGKRARSRGRRPPADGMGAVRCNSPKPAVGHGLIRLQHGSGRRDA